MSRTILVTGGSGQLGRALRARSWPADVQLVAPTRAALNLADAASVSEWAARPWTAVVNAGAYTAVDQAEREPEAAWAVNAAAPALLAAGAARQGAAFLQLSTGFVFGGDKAGDYVETDPADPRGVYAQSKLAGEEAVLDAHPRALVARTSWLVDRSGRNFLNAILARARAGQPLAVVADQFGNPTTAEDLAGAVAAMLAAQLASGEAPAGVFHVVNAGVTSWHGFAEAIVAGAPGMPEPRPPVAAIRSDEYPAAAPRPANCALSTAKFSAAFGLQMRPWRVALADLFAKQA